MTNVPTAIDLFCGCGGFSTGLLDAGVRVVAGFDNDAPSIVAYNYNHKYRGSTGVVADLATVSGSEVLALAGLDAVDIVVGGPPCQAFSIIGKQRGLEDARGNLVLEYARIVAEIRPRVFMLENVPNMERVQDGEVFTKVISALREAGYNVAHRVLLAADYGVPQMRKRMFIVGVRDGAAVVLPPRPTHREPGQVVDLFAAALPPYRTCKEAIGDLPDVDAPEARRVSNHEPTMHSPKMLAAFAELPQGKRDRKSFHDRLHADRLSYTLRAGTGNFSPLRPVHYHQDRVVSVRESARIQGFQDHFIWPDSLPRLQQYRQVGNAVCPPMARALATHVVAAIGWRLDPDAVRGDPTARAPAEQSTHEERLAARLSRLRGASMGDRPLVQAMTK